MNLLSLILQMAGGLFMAPRLLELITRRDLKDFDAWATRAVERLYSLSFSSSLLPFIAALGRLTSSLGNVLFFVGFAVFFGFGLLHFIEKHLKSHFLGETAEKIAMVAAGLFLVGGILSFAGKRIAEGDGPSTPFSLAARFHAIGRAIMGLLIVSVGAAGLFFFSGKASAIGSGRPLQALLTVFLYILGILFFAGIGLVLPYRLHLLPPRPQDLPDDPNAVGWIIYYYLSVIIEAVTIVVLSSLAALAFILGIWPVRVYLRLCATRTTKDVVLVTGGCLFVAGYVVAMLLPG
jgi:hypothetical protein